jgi:spermidine/putrescine transport system substrate-binding protein
MSQTTKPDTPGTIADRAITRRQLLAGGAMAGAAAFLAACGTGGTKSTPTPEPSVAPSSSAVGASQAPSAAASATPVPSPAAEVNWANWTYYIDVDANDPNKHPTLDAFTAKYGTKVNYKEVIDDNVTFFGTIQPALQQGADTGWDVVTLTDWMAAKLIGLGWIEQLDLGNMPNFVANLGDTYKGVNWDPSTDHHAPWQSGMTGIGYNPKKTGELSSMGTFFTVDPRWKGKTDVLSEMRDAIGLTMLYLGLDPANPTRDDCDKACAALQDAKSKGIILGFKGNAYAQDLAKGTAVVAMAWSGDMIQVLTDNPNMKFVVPDEGGMLWTDNNLIPKGAAHKYTAELLIDFYYQPDIAAQVEAYVNYICPVNGAADILKSTDPETASNPLIFPPDSIKAKLHIFGGLNEADTSYFDQQFAKVTGVG